VADAPPSPPLLLASTSPQRKAILEQLHIPFDVVAPKYKEETPANGDALQVVREHARGKARSVVDIAEGRPVVRDVGDGPGGPASMLAHDLQCVAVCRGLFCVLRCDDVERDVQLFEDRLALRRCRRQQKRRRRRRVSHVYARPKPLREATFAPTRQ
jgi:hypothetical protein